MDIIAVQEKISSEKQGEGRVEMVKQEKIDKKRYKMLCKMPIA